MTDNIVIKFDASINNADKVVRHMNRVSEAAERLQREMAKLNNMEVVINVVESKPKWWEFWK